MARWTPFEIITGTAAAFLAIVFACVLLEAGRIERGFAARAVQALEAAGLYWFAVEPSGRRLIVSGGAVDAAAAESAAARVAEVSGASAIENRIAAIGAAGSCQQKLDAARSGEPITFRKDLAELMPASEPVIAAVAQALHRCGVRIEVAVHAERGSGGAALGMAISQRRADQVAHRLVGLGVPVQQVVATGYGVTQPVARSADLKGRVPDNAAGARPDAIDAAAVSGETGRPVGQRVEFRVLGAAT